MKKLIFTKHYFDEVFKIEKNSELDSRGKFERVFCREEFSQFKLNYNINQINISETKKRGSIRGLHFQRQPYSEVKIVNCLRGEILDVMVDIRKNSPTYLKWTSITLSESKDTSIYIPEGFAHGFQTLSDGVKLLYFHSKPYTPSHESGLNPLDPKLELNGL